MNKLIAIGVAVAMLAAFTPTLDARESNTESHSYIPGPYVTVVWCSADDHAGIPLEPTEPWTSNLENDTYRDSDPENWTLDSANEVAGWGFSGEPECEPHDLRNDLAEQEGEDRMSGGYGGAATYLEATDFNTTVMTVVADDDQFGPQDTNVAISINSENDEEDVFVQLCGGTAATVIPNDVQPHWQGSSDEPYYLAWMYVDPVFVDENNNACFSSSGTIHITFSEKEEL